MNYLYYLIFLSLIILISNFYFKKKNFLISETGDNHQIFASHSKIPLTGGILIYFGIFFYFNENILLLFILTLLFILGIFSDLKILKSAKKRFVSQIILVISYIYFMDITINDTRLNFLDYFLEINLFNYLFVTFCILIVINGSNFLDGLNTIILGYYLIIIFVLLFLKSNNIIEINYFSIETFLYLLAITYFLNLLNFLYLGDSGSYILGFIFSLLLIDIYNSNEYLSPFFIIFLLWYPCFENLFSIIRKTKLKISAMEPDTNHFHQLIFYFLKTKMNLKVIYLNIITANLINLYNLLIFGFSVNYANHTKIQIGLILLNLILYTFIYLLLFSYKTKKNEK